MAEYRVVLLSQVSSGPIRHASLQIYLNGPDVKGQGLDIVSVLPVDGDVWIVLKDPD